MKIFDLEIVTPDADVFSGKVSSVKAPGMMGGFEVLYNHAPLISTLSDGKVRITKDDGSEISFNTKGGVLEVLKNKVIILVERILTENK